MPAYTFRCEKCGVVFTRRYSFQDDLSQVQCPNGHREVTRVFRPPAIVFKGSGFYVTDHGRKGNHSHTSTKKTSSNTAKSETSASASSASSSKKEATPAKASATQ
ncbi:MAG: hypothetical protein GXO56_00160 [Chloroflexi bacterium]|nr:hypothetical protein [Chloroflexota bacterium]